MKNKLNPITSNPCPPTGARAPKNPQQNRPKILPPDQAVQRPSRLQLSARVSPLIKNLISLERREKELASDGDAIESLILRGAISPAEQALILAAAEKRPLFAAALRVRLNQSQQ
jgi:hypothetical protein